MGSVAVVGTALLALSSAPVARAQAPAETVRPSPWVNRGLLLASLLTLDRPTRRLARDVQSEDGRDVSADARLAGSGGVVLPLALGATLVGGELLGDARGLRTGLAALGGIAAVGLATQAGKLVVGRSRPYTGDGPFRFRPFSGNASFPSGHTSLAFSVAGAIDALSDRPELVVPAYVLAGGAGLSRIYDDKHWLSDVTAGALLGEELSRGVTKSLLRRWGLRKPAGGASAGESAGPAGLEEGRTDLSLAAYPGYLGVDLRFRGALPRP